MLAPLFYRSYIISTPNNDNAFFYAKADSFFSSLKIIPDDSTKQYANPIEDEELVRYKKVKHFFFDPNTINVNEMVLLGLSIKQALVIERYRNNGGAFITPHDLAKIYIIDSLTFNRLKPWIKINPRAVNPKPRIKNDSILIKDERPQVVELNAADTLKLVKIKGIGRAYARRIIAYRDLLGGYVNIHQLSEIYGIKPELINDIGRFITIDSTRIKSINLNLVTYEELKKHPYITDYQAKAIIYYRSKVGTIKGIKELIDNKILPYDKYHSLKNYLAVD